MIEGKIIQFYRVRNNIKQAELGEGICSATHISKIERGLTEVSENTILLLANKLNIDMESEINTYLSLDSILKEWLQSIISKLYTKAEQLKGKLEFTPLLQIPNFYQFYTIILIRYYLSIGNDTLTSRLINEMENCKELSIYEENLLLHNKAIYLMKYKFDFRKAITILRKLDITQYNNPEYYYDLAVAYHSINSRVLAYHFAHKALLYFNEIRCFSRIIETEILILIQLEETDDISSNDTDYTRLIEMTVEYGLDHQKSILYHNFGYQKLRDGKFKEASECFKIAKDLRENKDSNYLGSLEGYLKSVSKGQLMLKEELLTIANEGLNLAQKTENILYIHVFNLHLFSIQDKKEEYFHYLETEANPYYKKIGIEHVTEHYQIQLFDYYVEKNEINKANLMAQNLLDKYRKNNQFV